MTLQVGIRVPCYRRWCRAEEVRRIAAIAEEAGFASLWVQDHVVAPLGHPELAVEGVSGWMGQAVAEQRPKTVLEYYAGDDWWLDPYVVWGFLSAATSRVRLASDIMVIPYRNPIHQAKMLGTLDVLSNGRMILGTGSGHVEAESQVLGLDFAARGRAHDEYIRIIRLLLSEDEVSFAGEFFSFERVRPLIRPVQTGGPPIWIGGNGKRSIRRAAELGDGWLPSAVPPGDLTQGLEVLREACQAAGRQQPPTVAVSLPSAIKLPVHGAPEGARKAMSAAEASQLLNEYAELGVAHVSLAFPMPTEQAYLAQVEAFATDVLPQLA